MKLEMFYEMLQEERFLTSKTVASLDKKEAEFLKNSILSTGKVSVPLVQNNFMFFIEYGPLAYSSAVK